MGGSRWLRSGNQLYPFNPFNALPVKWEDASDETNIINWGHSQYGNSGKNIDISGGQVLISSKTDEENSINLLTNVGTNETIVIKTTN